LDLSSFGLSEGLPTFHVMRKGLFSGETVTKTTSLLLKVLYDFYSEVPESSVWSHMLARQVG